MTFRPRRKIAGLSEEANVELFAIQNEIARELGAPASRIRFAESTFDVNFDDVVRARPTAAGMTIRAPAPSVQNQNGRFYVLLLGTAGACTVVPKSGTINGAASLSLTMVGLYEFFNDAEDWYTDASGRLDSLIVGDPGSEFSAGPPQRMQITLHGINVPFMLGQSDINNTFIGAQLFHRHSSASAPFLALARSRGTGSGHTIVNSGDTLGQWSFMGHDGTDYENAATISVVVDGTPGNDDMPGRIVFFTTPDGAFSATEKFRISSFGGLGVGGANFGTAGQVLTSGGPAAPPTWAPAGGGGAVSFSTATVTVAYGEAYAEAAVVDAAITALDDILVDWGQVSDDDENTPDMDDVAFAAIPAAGSMTIRVSANHPDETVGGAYKIKYLRG